MDLCIFYKVNSNLNNVNPTLALFFSGEVKINMNIQVMQLYLIQK